MRYLTNSEVSVVSGSKTIESIVNEGVVMGGIIGSFVGLFSGLTANGEPIKKILLGAAGFYSGSVVGVALGCIASFGPAILFGEKKKQQA